MVVGGGICGMTAALELSKHAPDVEVTVIEAGEKLGGKIDDIELEGIRVDGGPDSLLTRQPDAIALCEELGVATVPVAASKPLVWSKGELHEFPTSTLFGLPRTIKDIRESTLVSSRGTLRASADFVLFGTQFGLDLSIASLIRRRLGNEVLERMVEPLIGGIHAARADQLSATAVMPELLKISKEHRVLLRGVREALEERRSEDALFAAPVNGMTELVNALEARLRESGVTIETATEVRSITRRNGWEIRLSGGGTVSADQVILATPASVSGAILKEQDRTLGRELSKIGTVSVGVAVMTYEPKGIPQGAEISGILVPPVERRLTTAISFFDHKWPLRETNGQAVLRVSVARRGDQRALKIPRGNLLRALEDDVCELLGTTARPWFSTFRPWADALPHYAVGHPQLVERIEKRAGEQEGLHLAGASYRGLGLAACVVDGRRAARAVLDVQTRKTPAEQ